MVLLTLGGCHLLDGLVACDSIEECKEIVWCSGEEIVRGTVLTPRGSRRATLVERDVKSDKWSMWESVTCGSPLARGPATTLELVSTGT